MKTNGNDSGSQCLSIVRRSQSLSVYLCTQCVCISFVCMCNVERSEVQAFEEASTKQVGEVMK